MRTWPPGVSWYSSESAQLIASGTQRGTVTAMVPPGRSTRASSLMAARSSGMCSRTSDAITRSKVPSGKGSASASPCTAVAGWPGASSPCLHHGADRAAHLRHLVGTGVERHHGRTTPRRLEGVAPEAAAEIEQTVARHDAQPVIVDGQHHAAPGVTRARRRGARERPPLDTAW